MADSLDVDLELSVADSLQAATDLVADDEVDVAIVVADPPTVIAKQDRAESFVATVQQVVGVQALAERLEAQGVDPDEVGQALQDSTARVVRLDQDEASRRGSAFIVASAPLRPAADAHDPRVQRGGHREGQPDQRGAARHRPARPAAVRQGDRRRAHRHRHPAPSRVLPPIIQLAIGGDLPAGLGSAIVAGGPWFLLGLVLYLTTAGALGALVERQEEAGTVVMPMTILLVGSLLVAQSASDSPLGRLLAIFPFTSPMVMPARIAVGEASAGGDGRLARRRRGHRGARAAARRPRVRPGHRAHGPSPQGSRGADVT